MDVTIYGPSLVDETLVWRIMTPEWERPSQHPLFGYLMDVTIYGLIIFPLMLILIEFVLPLENPK